MALTVETGAGVEGADSYIALSDFQTFATDRGFAIPATDPECEAWLRRAAFAMDPMAWRGERVSSEQALAWPRSCVVTKAGESIAEDYIPRGIVYGQAMLAIEMYAADVVKDQPGGGAAVVEHTVKVDAIEESKKFDVVRRNAGSLPEPSATASSTAQFSIWLRYGGLHIPAIRV